MMSTTTRMHSLSSTPDKPNSRLTERSTVIRENPRDSEMWLEAYKAKFEGKGKPYGREEFDKLLGHCAVRVPFFNLESIQTNTSPRL